MPLNLEQYQEIINGHQGYFQVLDQELYNLCAEYPGHEDLNQVCCKVLIIGRTLTTGVERQIQTHGGFTADTITQLAEHLHAHSDGVDTVIDDAGDHDVVSPHSISDAVQAHYDFLEILAGITRNGNRARSFAAKYMHFHNPSVPLWDNYANESLKRHEGRWNPTWYNRLQVVGEADHVYRQYCCRLIQVYDELVELGHNPSPRDLDVFVMSAEEV